MRLNRLDLTRYGKFTDCVIDFGKAAAGRPDFHIVYGLNEAGKSTTLTAFLDLLFGMHPQTPYNFLHPYGAMRIGAELDIDGVTHELVRLKQRTGSLVDLRGAPINEVLVSSALGGISRDAYRTMFSLDDQSLKDGGNAIMQSKGELGELLFSASSGLAGLSKVLSSATDEAIAFHKKRSSSTKLAELKRSLEALKSERNATDTFAAAHAVLTASYQQAKAAYDGAAGALAEARIRHTELTRILTALPLASELARLLADPVVQADLPRPPAEWFALLPQLSRDETRLQALLQEKDRGIDQIEAEIAGIVVDEKGLSIAAHTELLADGSGRFRAAEVDLPKRRLALAEQEGMLARLLADLERPNDDDPHALLLPASSAAIIGDLIERRSGVDAELAAAERELERTRDVLDSLRAETVGTADNAGAMDGDAVARLESVLARLTGSNLVSRLPVEERARLQQQRNLDGRLALLAPWSGDLDALAATGSVDLRQIEIWRSQATAIDRCIAEHRNRHRDLVTDQVAIQAGLASLMAAGTIDDSEANALRAARDNAWQLHVGVLDKETAQSFEALLRQDDIVSASRLAHAHDLAALRQLQQRSAENTAAIERQAQLLDEAQADYGALAKTIAGFLPDVFITQDDALERLATLESWMARRFDALAARDDLQRADAAIADIRTELDRYQAELLTGLAKALTKQTAETSLRGASLDVVVQATHDVLARHRAEAEARARHEKSMADLSRDLTQRERDWRQAQAASEAWQAGWRDALANTWLSDKAGSVAAVRGILQVLAKLPGILKERLDMAQRVGAMERDQAQFRIEVAALLSQVDDGGSADDPVSAAGRLLDRHRAALRNRQIIDDKQIELSNLRAQRAELATDLAVHTARKTELTAYFGTDTLAAVSGFLDQAKERERMEDRISGLREQIAQSLRASSFAEAEMRLSDTDIHGVEHEAAELAARIEDLTDRARDLYAETSRARDKLDAVGGDDTVARIEAKRRTILLEIEDSAARYLALKAGILAAERALHTYREKHRSSMMNRASEAFRLITGGNYSGLATQFDKDREILIGVAQDGGSKLAETMSTGTQFQLYLALRLAGYEEFAAVRPAVPFVADDIMESFDNPRSTEVFRLLGEMSKIGQVIYLTHHWHLCELAKTVVPEVQIHRLP
ncbi:ATP-binding protein [Rhizobium sp. SL42]|uniref:ATP-binding protein n=1 Tax=Rhizobium sp. SL42 TaxID=2806346 RepID=UPI001F1D3B6B|nr:AAA family ATPase [Rhizobium sp. SL42]UJW77293.1 AAA family ATPase [Rhizobium sp. SL42]